MRTVFNVLFCLVLAAAAPAPGAREATGQSLQQTVLHELGQHQAVRATFEQTRSNPALAQPQVSHGQLLFVMGHGMLWQTTAPFQETLVMRGSHVLRLDAQGHAQRVRGGDRGASKVSQMLQSLLGGDTGPALRQFDIAATGTPSDWTLVFTPRQSRVAKVLASITLHGGAFLDGIAVAMANGEQTQLKFSDTREAGALDEHERSALDIH